MTTDAASILILMNNRGVEYVESGRLLSANHMFIQALSQSQGLVPSTSILSLPHVVDVEDTCVDRDVQPSTLQQTCPTSDSPMDVDLIDQFNTTNSHRPVIETDNRKEQREQRSKLYQDDNDDGRPRIHTIAFRIHRSLDEDVDGFSRCFQVSQYIAIVVFNLALTCHLILLNETKDRSSRDLNGCFHRLEATARLYELTIMLYSPHKEFLELGCFSMAFLTALNNLGQLYDLIHQQSKAYECFSRLLSFLTLLREFDFASTAASTSSKVGMTRDSIAGLYSEVVALLCLKRSITAPSA